jgi:threonine dehydrogenase-like Zn-dependent dehydrogenase
VDAFSAARQPGPCAAAVVLAMSYDGKGIVMRPDALRQATAKAAASACRKLATRLSPGEKAGRKQMAELAVVYDAAPAPRTPADIIGAPGQDTGRPRARGPLSRLLQPGGTLAIVGLGRPRLPADLPWEAAGASSTSDTG